MLSERARAYGRQYRLVHRDAELARHKIYNEGHKELLRVARGNRAKKIKMEVLSHYSETPMRQCAHCSMSDIDVLTIDHMNGGGNAHRRTLGLPSGTTFREWLRRNKFPEGYQVLCANCNLKKRIKGD